MQHCRTVPLPAQLHLFENKVLIRQLGTSQNIHCLSHCSVFKMSQILKSKIGRDAFIYPKQMFGFFPSQNSAWRNFLMFLVLLHFRVTEPNWSISHQVEAFAFAEITTTFPGHGRNFPFSCVLDFSAETLMESCRCCCKSAATGKGRHSH